MTLCNMTALTVLSIWNTGLRVVGVMVVKVVGGSGEGSTAHELSSSSLLLHSQLLFYIA